jgi:hypothetical protein
MEHRWGQRIALKIPVQITFADRSLERKAELTNLSITGALIKVDFAPRILSRLEILIEASIRYASDSVSIAAYVARYHRLGLGVEWCGPGSRRLIELLRLAVAQSLASDAPTAPGVHLSPPPGLSQVS